VAPPAQPTSPVAEVKVCLQAIAAVGVGKEGTPAGQQVPVKKFQLDKSPNSKSTLGGQDNCALPEILKLPKRIKRKSSFFMFIIVNFQIVVKYITKTSNYHSIIQSCLTNNISQSNL
jgi:hypothetical protein